uniref:uncharacterized aarF domain-containing protein kinase 5 n=1 Tax=Lonchura striata TaxID=40157 RepID=UPI000B4C7E3C|nr:uncharacterized aarF domain-containing protein kinase 5 [Lonchura striata domestica]
MSRCHRRAGQRLLQGALSNGGLYVKLGQGLSAMEHLLPPELGGGLRPLEDMLVRRGPDGRAQLVLLDHGLYETLSERDRLALCGLWRAIVLRDREGMRERAAELGVQDYFLFCEMLMQRPLSRHSGRLSAAERGYMRGMAARRFPQVLRVLRALPRPMLLVFRNINTVRSVHGAMGAPADRHGIMARSAVRGWRRLRAGPGGSVWQRLRWAWLRFRLEAAALRLLGRWGALPGAEQLQLLLRA